MKQFYFESGESVDLIRHTSEIFSRYALSGNLKVYVGCDSQNRRYSTSYVTVVAFRYGNKGVHCIYSRDYVKPKIRDRWIRLWGEVERSIKLALILKQNGYRVDMIDLDFNRKEIAKSSEMVSSAKGYVAGMGFECSVKPELQCASRFADHLVKQ
jgi:predicted RNase H-related nuclease YkuK (DUF458 family)